MKDRVPGAPGQYTASLTPGELTKLENGKPFSITLVRDDQPLVEGTPYSKTAVLPDEVAAALCPDVEDPTPADAFRALAGRTKAKTDFGEYTTLADYINNAVDDKSTVICYTDSKLSDFPDTSNVPGSGVATWIIEICKLGSNAVEISASCANSFGAGEIHRWKSFYNGYTTNPITWTKFQLYTGSGDAGDSVVAQGTSNGWVWRKWASGLAECWKTVSCSSTDGYTTNVVYVTEQLPFDIVSNRTIQVTQSNTGFGVPTTEIAKFATAWSPGLNSTIRVFAQKTDAYTTGATVSASVYVCGTYV